MSDNSVQLDKEIEIKLIITKKLVVSKFYSIQTVKNLTKESFSSYAQNFDYFINQFGLVVHPYKIHFQLELPFLNIYLEFFSIHNLTKCLSDQS